MKLSHSILVLKKEPSRLNSLLNSLTQTGYAIVLASTAEDAKAQATAKRFPLVLIETELLASVIELLRVLRRADALSSIVVAAQSVDFDSVVHSMRLRIADIFSNGDDESIILGRVRSLLPAIPVVLTQLTKEIDQLAKEKQTLEERLLVLAGEFELWQKTVTGAITCATAHIGVQGSTTAPSAINQTEVLEFELGPTSPGAVAPTTPTDPVMARTASGGLRLKPLIDFIAKQAGGGTVGQLAVYRVFLQIPLHLLHVAKIRSFQLVDDTFEIHSPALTRVILAAVRETLGVEYRPAMAGAT